MQLERLGASLPSLNVHSTISAKGRMRCVCSSLAWQVKLNSVDGGSGEIPLSPWDFLLPSPTFPLSQIRNAMLGGQTELNALNGTYISMFSSLCFGYG